MYRGAVIRPSFGPIKGAPHAAAADDVLKQLFANRERLVASYHFLPSALYAGGDPAAIPADLRPYFSLRKLQITERLLDGCSTKRLRVSGKGVSVALAKRRRGSRCLVTARAQEGATGKRDLLVTRRGKVTRRLRNAVHLANAIPVKPPFLK